VKKLSLLVFVCMVSTLTFAQSVVSTLGDSSGGGPIVHGLQQLAKLLPNLWVL